MRELSVMSAYMDVSVQEITDKPHSEGVNQLFLASNL